VRLPEYIIRALELMAADERRTVDDVLHLNSSNWPERSLNRWAGGFAASGGRTSFPAISDGLGSRLLQFSAKLTHDFQSTRSDAAP
jgi:hypothetical protein